MLKKLSLYTLLLFFVPIFAWISGFQWQSDENFTIFDHFLYYLTETGSTPYAIITCGIFALLFYPLIKNPRTWIKVVMVLAFSMVITQGIKSALKQTFAEPRPFIVAMLNNINNANNQEQAIEEFYTLSREQRSELVAQFYQQHNETPHTIAQHRTHEVGYSFPSGHTIFAVSWLLLAVGFREIFSKQRAFANCLVGFMALWSMLMLISRLRLGMHFPIDLFVSTLIAWLIHCILFIFLQEKRFFSRNK